MQGEKIITEREAILGINIAGLRKSLSVIEPLNGEIIGRGTPCSKGVMRGMLVFDAVECLEHSYTNTTILCVTDDNIVNIELIRETDAILMLNGHVYANTAAVCRELGKPCISNVVGLQLITTNEEIFLATERGGKIKSGNWISVDGGNGTVRITKCPERTALLDNAYFLTILAWSDKFRRMKVNCVVESGNLLDELKLARRSGADGIGCLNTNCMFYQSENILELTRTIIIDSNSPKRDFHLATMTNVHRGELRNLLRECENQFVAIKLLDVALSTLMPRTDVTILKLPNSLNVRIADNKHLLHDENPSVGIRGCRVAALLPGITETQVRSIVLACLDLLDEGCHVSPKILIPYVFTSREMEEVSNVINKTATEVS